MELVIHLSLSGKNIIVIIYLQFLSLNGQLLWTIFIIIVKYQTVIDLNQFAKTGLTLPFQVQHKICVYLSNELAYF